MSKPINYCKLCGEQLEYSFYHDCDHMGPMSSGSWEQDKHVCKSNLKKMCINCAFYRHSCINPQVKESVFNKINAAIRPFTFTSIKIDLLPHNTREHCEYWKLDESIASEIFK